ncbi:Zn(2)-C6 fungal-type domain-containing protein [Plasmodiophora brassicae]
MVRAENTADPLANSVASGSALARPGIPRSSPCSWIATANAPHGPPSFGIAAVARPEPALAHVQSPIARRIQESGCKRPRLMFVGSPTLSNAVAAVNPDEATVSAAMSVPLVGKSASRVNTACSACAARKVRCDSNRPCRRCVQLGNADSCVDRPAVPTRAKAQKPRISGFRSCDACHKAKVACTAGRPCPRCVRMDKAEQCVSGVTEARIYPTAPCSRRVIVPDNVRQVLLNAPMNYSVEEIKSCFVKHPMLSRGLSALLAPLLTGPEIRGIIDAMREKICLPCTDDFWFDAISLDPGSVVNIKVQEEGSKLAFIHFEIDMRANITSMVVNEAAHILFGYEVAELQAYLMANRGRVDEAERTVPLIWLLFDPWNWPDLATIYLNFFLRQATFQVVPVRITRKDTGLVFAIASWHATISPDGLVSSLSVSFDVSPDARVQYVYSG